MVATYLTPGVYVEELPGGARAIEGVATSVTLFIGYARRGPIGRAVRIASWDEYERKFGGVVNGDSVGINDLRKVTRGPTVDYIGHSVFAYFQNGGAVAYICRVAEGDAPAANAVTLTKAAAAILQPEPLAFEATDEGSWANELVVDVRDDAANPGRFIATIGRLSAKGQLVPVERFDDVDLATNDEKFLGDVLEQQSVLVRLTEDVPNAVSVSPSAQQGFHRSTDVSGVNLDLTAADEPARTFSVQLNPADNGETNAIADAKPYATLEALAVDLERKLRADRTDANVPADARDGVTVTVERDGAIAFMVVRSGLGAADSKARVTNQRLGNTLNFAAAGANTGAQAVAATQRAVLFGGTDGYAPFGTDLYVDSLEILELNPDINVIVTPNAAWDDDGRPIVEAALAHCEKMKNRVVIIDPPAGVLLDDPTRINALALPTSTYSQLYYPWAQVANPVHHPVKAPGAPVTVLVPPAGFAAGMWSRIDGRRGVWKAPAGVEALLLGVGGFQYDVGDPQQEVLNPAGVNALRAKPGYGRVIWGARTLATNANPEWRYIPVRRTAIMIEEALRRGIQWAVFEPNDDRLWSSLRLSAESYMNGLFRSGAFQGTVASQAYRVDCGLGSTMEQGDIDRGYVILRVKFAPLKPAEFVIIQIQQLAGQS